MEDKWSEENSLLLISLYRSLPQLWNPKHKDYKHRDIRQDSFSKISKEMNIPKDEIERKLKNLVSHFWRENKKVNNKRSGAGADSCYISKWFTFKSFEFLKDKNDCRTSLDTEGSKEASGCVQSNVSATVVNEVVDDIININSDPPRTEQLPQEPIFGQKKLKRKVKYKDQLGHEIFGMVWGIYDKRNERDEFTILGQEVEMSVRQLKSPYAQKTVKHKIHTLLYEASLGHYDQPAYPSQMHQAHASHTPVTSFKLMQNMNPSSPNYDLPTNMYNIPTITNISSLCDEFNDKE